MNKAYLDTWTESERGWGSKPDGCSIHLTEEDYKAFVQDYWDGMPEETPDEYTRPDKNLKEVVLSDALFEKLNKQKLGIRLWDSEFDDLKDAGEILFKG